MPGFRICASNIASHQPRSGTASLSVRHATTCRPWAQCLSNRSPTDRAPAGPQFWLMRTDAKPADPSQAPRAGAESAGEASSTTTTRSGLSVCSARAANVLLNSATSASDRQYTGSTTARLGRPSTVCKLFAAAGNLPAWASNVLETSAAALSRRAFSWAVSGLEPHCRAKAARPQYPPSVLANARTIKTNVQYKELGLSSHWFGHAAERELLRASHQSGVRTRSSLVCLAAQLSPGISVFWCLERT
mmetsp:Transcript_93733/g.260957  ORF Transcript_93733/g.260957 Transcript_93733/m.260957 type:complete len:247 (-) Transcript_93733:182-922(-)